MWNTRLGTKKVISMTKFDSLKLLRSLKSIPLLLNLLKLNVNRHYILSATCTYSE